jgi:hypothetical protein
MHWVALGNRDPEVYNLCKGKSFTEGTFMATKKKAKKKKH